MVESYSHHLHHIEKLVEHGSDRIRACLASHVSQLSNPTLYHPDLNCPPKRVVRLALAHVFLGCFCHILATTATGVGGRDVDCRFPRGVFAFLEIDMKSFTTGM